MIFDIFPVEDLHMLLLLLTVGFIAVHPNAGVHFAALGEALDESLVDYVAYAADFAKEKMEGRIPFTDLNDDGIPFSQLGEETLKKRAASLADRIAREANAILVDVGSPFSKYLIEELAEKHVSVWPYYDNFEGEVPGGYSSRAQEMIKIAGKCLFASVRLSEKWGIGYYPLEETQKSEQFKPSDLDRIRFLEEHNLDSTLPLILFLGGANSAYEKAFNDFATSVGEGIPGWNILLQRHPRAASEGIEDGAPFALSHVPLDEALSYADVVLYYQTTSSLKSILLGIPTGEWGGYQDSFVRAGLIPSFQDRQALQGFLDAPFCPVPKVGLDLVGYSPDWKKRWLSLVEQLK